MADTYTLVTGASEGIGKELARQSAKAGRSVILAARSKEKLEALAVELRDYDIDVIVMPADLGKPKEVERLWKDATAKGRRIDILVNNAGLGSHGYFAEADWAREALSIEVNVVALTRLMKLAVPHMIEARQGRILNVASIAGFMPGPNMAVYHATKAYVVSLSEAVNVELHGKNVSVTALCPGPTQSNFFNEADMKKVRLTRGRLPTAASVAEAGWRAMIARKSVAVPGVMNTVMAFMPRITPRVILNAVTKRVMAKAS